MILLCIWGILFPNEMHANVVPAHNRRNAVAMLLSAEMARSASALEGQANTIIAANGRKESANPLLAATTH